MTFIALDTLAVVKDLKAAGFTDDQAEAVARVVRRGQDVDLSELATKAGVRTDLMIVKTDLEKALAETTSDLEKALAETKAGLEKALAETKTGLEKSIAETKAGLEKAILETRAGLERMMAKTKAETLKWMLGSMGIQTIVIISAVLAVVRASH
jgi:DNA-binding transcriptional regulator GbsR (MarR family)